MSFLKVDPVIKKASNVTYEPLAPGKYDAVLSAIIDLGVQITTFNKEKPKPQHQLRFLFEIPSEERENANGEKNPAILKKDLNLSAFKDESTGKVGLSEKSHLHDVINNLLAKTASVDETYKLITTKEGIQSLLGLPIVLKIKNYNTKHNTVNNEIEDWSEFDRRMPQDMHPKAVREPFVFSAYDPDLEVFREKLSRYTRDKIMSALNADEYPKELHKAYAEVKEEEAQKSTK